MKKTRFLFYLGKNYDLRDINEFKVFEYDKPEDYHKKLNESRDALKEGHFVGKYVFYNDEIVVEKLNGEGKEIGKELNDRVEALWGEEIE